MNIFSLNFLSKFKIIGGSSIKVVSLILLLFGIQKFASQLRNVDSLTQKNSIENKIAQRKLDFLENKNYKMQLDIFSSLDKNIKEARLLLKKGVDYKSYIEIQKVSVDLKKTAIDGVIKNKKEFQTVRGLTLTSLMLNEVYLITKEELGEVKIYHEKLSNIQNKVDSLSVNETLLKLPKDTLKKNIYLSNFYSTEKEVDKVNRSFKTAMDSIDHMQIQGNKFQYELQQDVIETDKIRRQMQNNLFTERRNLLSKKDNPSDFVDSLADSLIKGIVLSVYYFKNHNILFILAFFGFFMILSYLKLLKNKYIKSKLYKDFNYDIIILKNPLLSSFLLTLTLFQFVLPKVPFCVLSALWYILLIALTKFFNKTRNKRQKKIWYVLALIITAAIFINNLLIPSILEVIVLFALSLATILFTFYILRKNVAEFTEPFPIIMKVVILIEIIGLGFLLSGNYNFGKTLITVAIFALFLSFLLVHVCYLIFDIFKYSEFLKQPNEEYEDDMNYSVYERPKLHSYHYYILIVAGFFLIFKNTFWYQSLTEPFMDEIQKDRNIGDFSFSYDHILLFFAVICISVFISKIVSFLSTDHRNSDGKSTFGSWLLLIRICIITAGFIFAFMIAGFPIDRITIILSALGVGIGLGLQSVTNNLVSGLIIAFEKPVNIGDTIEINGKVGKMKSISIRSSVIKTFDGADLIIPNGNLLSQDLINWTLGSTKSRFKINFGVSYGTDLDLTKEIIQKILHENHNVLKNPKPIIVVTEFQESAINFSVKFWVIHFGIGDEVKSDILMEIDKKLRENSIQIPFTQQDIFIKNFPQPEKQDDENKS